jgi:hypothetical protein
MPLQGDLSKILCARVNPDMPSFVTAPPWSEARYGNCFDVLGIDVMFDHGGSASTGGAPRPRLMEINVGPDLTAHDGWDDELNIHSQMMVELAGLLASRCVRRSCVRVRYHLHLTCLLTASLQYSALIRRDMPLSDYCCGLFGAYVSVRSLFSMEPAPGLSDVRHAMRQHVSAEEAADIDQTEAEELWQLMLEREHLRSFDRLVPPWQPPQRAGGGALDEAEKAKDQQLAEEISGICLGSTLKGDYDSASDTDGREAKLRRAAELLRAREDE